MRIGEILMKGGFLNTLQLQTALAEQERWGGRIGAILIQMGYVTEDVLIQALAHQLGVPQQSVEDVQVAPEILSRFGKDNCASRGILPLSFNQTSGTLLLATSEPQKPELWADLAKSLGLKVEVRLAGADAIARAILRLFKDIPDAPAGQVTPAPGADEPTNLPELQELADRQLRAVRAIAEIMKEKGLVASETQGTG
jgi:type IV pilus assembly protein PilB